MKKSKAVLAVLALTLALGGCRKQPPPPPEPVDEAPTVDLEAERRAADERARLAADERARLAAEEAARREAEARMRATLEEMVFFDYDDARIKPEAQAKLGAKARILRDNPALRFRIEGHCDERGSNEYNDALGHRRAEAIMAYFTGAGLDARRFELVSFGEDRPLATGQTEGAWARNRRGEFRVVAGLGS